MLDFDVEAIAVLGTAFVAGGLGGLAYGLLKWHELRSVAESNSYIPNPAIGMLVGAVAATAFLFFFPPDTETTTVEVTTTDDSGDEVIVDPEEIGVDSTREFDFIQVVALSLIIGSAGGTFLGAMQTRLQAQTQLVNATVIEAQVTATIDTAASEVRAVSEQVTSLAQAAVDTALPVPKVMDEVHRAENTSVRRIESEEAGAKPTDVVESILAEVPGAAALTVAAVITPQLEATVSRLEALTTIGDT